MTEFARLIQALTADGVEFVIIGGIAATAHGSAHVTEDGIYDRLLPRSIEVTVFGTTCRIIDLEMLIELKRAAGRPKDLERLAELEALLEEREKQ